MKLKHDHLKELENRIKNLRDKSVKVGMFDNTKRGDEFSNWTNVSLFAYLNSGDISMNIPPRPVTQIVMAFNPISTSPMKRELSKYFSDITKKKGKKHVTDMLKVVGYHYRDEIVQLFGNSVVLAPNAPMTVALKEKQGFKGQNPLIETGDMRSKISFKIDNKVWEYGG
jgi:hypothetical protein